MKVIEAATSAVSFLESVKGCADRLTHLVGVTFQLHRKAKALTNKVSLLATFTNPTAWKIYSVTVMPGIIYLAEDSGAIAPFFMIGAPVLWGCRRAATANFRAIIEEEKQKIFAVWKKKIEIYAEFQNGGSLCSKRFSEQTLEFFARCREKGLATDALLHAECLLLCDLRRLLDKRNVKFDRIGDTFIFTDAHTSFELFRQSKSAFFQDFRREECEKTLNFLSQLYCAEYVIDGGQMELCANRYKEALSIGKSLVEAFKEVAYLSTPDFFQSRDNISFLSDCVLYLQRMGAEVTKERFLLFLRIGLPGAELVSKEAYTILLEQIKRVLPVEEKQRKEVMLLLALQCVWNKIISIKNRVEVDLAACVRELFWGDPLEIVDPEMGYGPKADLESLVPYPFGWTTELEGLALELKKYNSLSRDSLDFFSCASQLLVLWGLFQLSPDRFRFTFTRGPFLTREVVKGWKQILSGPGVFALMEGHILAEDPPPLMAKSWRDVRNAIWKIAHNLCHYPSFNENLYKSC